MRIFALLFLFLLLSGCGISGTINRTIITSPDGTITENCKASYSNNSWGTATNRDVHGCDAGGNAGGIDNTAMIAVPLSLIQKLEIP